MTLTVLRAPASTRRHIAVNMVMLHAWKRELDFLLASKNLSLCMEESLCALSMDGATVEADNRLNP